MHFRDVMWSKRKHAKHNEFKKSCKNSINIYCKYNSFIVRRENVMFMYTLESIRILKE